TERCSTSCDAKARVSRTLQAAPFFSAGGSTRSTSTVHSFSAAAIAPTAASTGASTAPITPMVSGNSTIVLPSCLMMTRRTLPSWRSRFTASTSCSPATLNESVYVRSDMNGLHVSVGDVFMITGFERSSTSTTPGRRRRGFDSPQRAGSDDFDFDGLRFGGLGFRQADVQHAVLELSFHVAAVD